MTERLMMAILAIGMLTGIFLGRRQLLRWDIYNKKKMAWLVIGTAVIWILGGYLMQVYGYYICKQLRYLCLQEALLWLAFVDAEKKIIPNRALLLLVGVRTVLLLAEIVCFPQLGIEIVLSAVVGLLGGGGLFLLSAVVTRKGLGMGDVKMVAVMGYYLGFAVLMSNLIITMTLTLFAGLGILLLKKQSLHAELPFAPFAAVGTIFTILMGF